MNNIAWPMIGHSKAEAQFLQAAESGNLHHGWILEGPSGIGKSLLARRMSGYVLNACQSDKEHLNFADDDPVVQKMLAGSHPDFRWVWRKPDDKGKVKQDIPVDEIRGLNHFFSLKSGLGGWRVGVIDSLDELNRNGANALLKTLEEPPPKSLLILISHGSRPVLPTIKSRCRSIRLEHLNDEDTMEALKLAGASDPRATSKIARGRPGLGLALSTPNGLTASNATRSYLRALPQPSDSLLAQAIRTAGADATSYSAFTGEVLDWLHEAAPNQNIFAQTWLELSAEITDTLLLNMDRTQSAAKILARLQAAAQTR